mmetsp:Transcript_11993/g.51468  ORF Transcript_11993/g.51468 Transcript_11993/m.51468 type:complete len:373 (-) Transcript_11993:2161-3279(-)
MCGSEYPKNSGPLMAVFFGSSPNAARAAVTRFKTSAQAAVADFATMGSSKPSSAVNLNAGPLSPSRISWTHRVRSPFGSSHRMYCLVVRYPTGRMYAAEWYPSLSAGCTTPRHSRVTPCTGPTGNRTRPFLSRGSLSICILARSTLSMLPNAAARGPRAPGPRCSRGFRAFFSRGSLGAGGWTANLPPSAAHRRRTRRLSTRFSGHSTAITSVEGSVKSIFAGDRSGFDLLFKGVFSFEASAEPGEPDDERLRFERRPVEGGAASSPAEGSGDPFAAAMADSQDASRPSSASARMASHRPHPCRSVPTRRPRSSRGDHQGAGLSQCSSTFFTSGRSESHSAASSAARGPPAFFTALISGCISSRRETSSCAR